MSRCHHPTTRAVSAIAIALAILLSWTGAVVQAQNGTKNGEWRTFGGDLGSTRYSPLDQISRDNFNNLQIAWRLKSDNFGREFNWQTSPVVVGGVLYTTIGARRNVVAVAAGTGELLWMFRA